MARTFEECRKVVRKAIKDALQSKKVGYTDIFVSDMKAVIDFKDGTNTWFMYSYSRVTYQDIFDYMIGFINKENSKE